MRRTDRYKFKNTGRANREKTEIPRYIYMSHDEKKKANTGP